MSIYKSSKNSEVVKGRTKVNLFEKGFSDFCDFLELNEKYFTYEDYTMGSGRKEGTIKEQHECRDAEADFVLKNQQKIEMKYEGIDKKYWLDGSTKLKIHLKMLGSSEQIYHPLPKRFYSEFGISWKYKENYIPVDLGDVKDVINFGGVLLIWLRKQNGFNRYYILDEEYIMLNNIGQSGLEYEGDMESGFKHKTIINVKSAPTFYSFEEVGNYLQKIMNDDLREKLIKIYKTNYHNFKNNKTVVFSKGNSYKQTTVKKKPHLFGKINDLVVSIYINLFWEKPVFNIYSYKNFESLEK